jgi:hypothetical protein
MSSSQVQPRPIAALAHKNLKAGTYTQRSVLKDMAAIADVEPDTAPTVRGVRDLIEQRWMPDARYPEQVIAPYCEAGMLLLSELDGKPDAAMVCRMLDKLNEGTIDRHLNPHTKTGYDRWIGRQQWHADDLWKAGLEVWRW